MAYSIKPGRDNKRLYIIQYITFQPGKEERDDNMNYNYQYSLNYFSSKIEIRNVDTI